MVVGVVSISKVPSLVIREKGEGGLLVVPLHLSPFPPSPPSLPLQMSGKKGRGVGPT